MQSLFMRYLNIVHVCTYFWTAAAAAALLCGLLLLLTMEAQHSHYRIQLNERLNLVRYLNYFFSLSHTQWFRDFRCSCIHYSYLKIAIPTRKRGSITVCFQLRPLKQFTINKIVIAISHTHTHLHTHACNLLENLSLSLTSLRMPKITFSFSFSLRSLSLSSATRLTIMYSINQFVRQFI